MLDKNIEPFIQVVREIMKTHELGVGKYQRWRWNDAENTREMGVNEYGCADAANILYTIGDFPSDDEERSCWVKTLQELQHSDGLFVEATHHPIHTTAHCIAALELFDKKPLYRLTAFDKYKTKEGLYDLLDNLNWAGSPWDNSHQGAGIFAALNLSDEATEEWNEWYFKWFWDEIDPESGMWRKGYIGASSTENYKYMAGTFHYLFNHEYANRPLRYPEKLIDVCIDMYKNDGLPDFFAKSVNFIEVDLVYCITRAMRQCSHRYDECIEILTDFADYYIDNLFSLDPEKDDQLNDLHMLFGAVCCLAELQKTLKGCIKTKKPLKLVLDRRPFI